MREQEVEQEMLKEMTVLNKIRKFEKLGNKTLANNPNAHKLWTPQKPIMTDHTINRRTSLQKPAPPPPNSNGARHPPPKGPVSYVPITPLTATRSSSIIAGTNPCAAGGGGGGGGLNKFISSANQKLERISMQVANTLTETAGSGGGGSDIRASLYNNSGMYGRASLTTSSLQSIKHPPPPRIVAPQQPRPSMIKQPSVVKVENHLTTNTRVLVKNPLLQANSGAGVGSFRDTNSGASFRGSTINNTMDTSRISHVLKQSSINNMSPVVPTTLGASQQQTNSSTVI